MMFTTIEALENRLCLSVTLTDGTLLVEGTPGNDNIQVTTRRGDFVVRERGTDPQTFPAAQVQQIVVNSLAGNDRLRVDRTTIPASIDAGAGNDRIVGGFGNDVIVGGEGNDVINARAGNDQLFGLTGVDRLTGGTGTDTADVGGDLLSGIEERPTRTPAESAAIVSGAGLTLPASGVLQADTIPDTTTTTQLRGGGGGGGGGGIVASGQTASAVDTGAPGSILLDASGQAIDRLAPTSSTTSAVTNDLLNGASTPGSTTLTSGTLASSGSSATLLNGALQENATLGSPTSSSLFSTTQIASTTTTATSTTSATTSFFG
jgi:Ca2+-binding RTX toxin-like protein